MMRHRLIDPELGGRILASILVNGDTVPDVIVVAAQVAEHEGRTVDTKEIETMFLNEGVTLDEQGRIVDIPDESRLLR